MADRSIPQQSLNVQQAILKELEGCSSAPLYHLLHKYLPYLPEILDELNEQTVAAFRILAEDKKQTALLSQILDALTSAPTLTASVAIAFPGEPMSLNALTFSVGDPAVVAPIVTFLADGVTASGATLSNVVVTFSDPSATVVLNADGVSVTATPVAASTGPVTGTLTATTTDTDSVVANWTQSFTVTTNAVVVPPEQLTQSIGIQFP